MEHDPALDALLGLDGQIYVVDPEARYWVRFRVNRVATTPERPHGLNNSLILHDRTGARLVGFDNAHPVRTGSGPAGRRRMHRDHRHRFRTIRAYEYRDVATLLADFWAKVDAVLKERGIIS